jgi:hypothetical protein
MGFLYFQEKNDTNNVLNKFFKNQKNIFDVKQESKACKSYSNDFLYKELSEVLRADKYFEQNSILIEVCFLLFLLYLNIRF